MSRILAVLAFCLLFVNSVGMAQDNEQQVIGRGRVFQAVWSPDSQSLALATALGIWLYPAGDLDHPSLLEMAGGATGVAFSPDGPWLAASSSDGTIHLWKNDGFRWIPDAELEGDGIAMRGVAISPWSNWIAAWDEAHRIWLWELATSAPAPQPFLLEGHENRINGIAFDPSGTRLVSWGWGDTFFLWNVATASILHRLHYIPRHDADIDEINAAAFSPDGSLVAMVGPGTHIFDVVTGDEVVSLPTGVGDNGTLGVAFSPDGRQLATGSGDWPEDDFRVCLWVVSTWENQVCFNKHLGAVKSVAFSPDGLLLASGSADGTVQLWDTTQEGWLDQPLMTVAEFPNSGDAWLAWQVAFSPDGKKLVANNGTAWVWTSGTSGDITILPGHSNAFADCALSSMGKELTLLSYDGMIRRWYLQTGNEVFLTQSGLGFLGIRHQFNDLVSMALSADGTKAVFGDGMAEVWIVDTATGEIEGSYGISHLSFYASAVAFNADSTILAAAGGHPGYTVELVHLNGKDLLTPIGRFWSADSYPPEAHVLAFSPDSTRLASGNSRGEVHLWNTQAVPLAEDYDVNLIAMLGTYENTVNVLRFSPDGKFLASGNDLYVTDTLNSGIVRIWDMASLREVAVLSGHQGGVNAIAFQPNGDLIATASMSGMIYFWDMNGKKLSAFQGDLSGIGCLMFDLTNQHLVSAGEDGIVRFWDIPE